MKRETAIGLHVRMVLALLLTCLSSVTWAAPNVVPPSTTICDNATPPPASGSGSTPATPGRWWNPKRNGTGWDFTFSSDNQAMYLAWYTYNTSRKPVWIASLANQIDKSNPNLQKWSSDLYQTTWTGTGPSAGFRVGSVAISFYPNDPTRAAIRWQWDAAGQGSYDECVFDMFRSGSVGQSPFAPMGASTVNSTYGGAWHEPQRDGYGIYFSIGQVINNNAIPSGYYEFGAVLAYDVLNNPVWVQGQAGPTSTPPPTTRTLILDYTRAGPGYPNGVPTNDCLVSSQCYTGYAGVGTLTRTFSSPQTGTATLVVSANSANIGGDADIYWLRPDSGSGSVAIAKLTQATSILVDRLSCTLAAGQTTCPITVNWGGTYPAAKPYRIVVATGASTQLSTLAEGEYIDNLPAGSHVRYELHNGAIGSGQLLSRTPDVRVLGQTIAPDQTIESLATELPAHNAALGAMDGSADVSGGAATYTVPIKVPPGRRGMQPSLALSYSSRDGAGIAGLGMSLSGLSSIHRCPRTPEQDGVVGPVDFSTNDRLCLDGQRLVVVSTIVTTYGTSGAVYRKEIDDFTRVTQLGGDINAAGSYFKAEFKSGEVVYYGGIDGNPTGNARTIPSIPSGTSSPLSWQIRRREDRVGNNVYFDYAVFGAGEHLIQTIRYTGFNGAPGDREVRFMYTARNATGANPDVSSSYIGGALVRQTQRLDKIQTWAGAEHVREYRISGYTASPVSGRGRTTSITECAYASGVPTCLAPTMLTWRDAPAGGPAHIFDTAAFNIPGLPAPVIPAGGASASARPVTYSVAGDFDGDGSSELAVGVRNGNTSPTLSAYDYYLVSLTADRTLRRCYSMPSDVFFDARSAKSGAQFADFDNDGRADLPRRVGGVLKISFLNPSGVSTQCVAGTGQFTDLAAREGATDIPLASDANVEFAGDLNGDGRSDLLISRPGTVGACSGAKQLISYYNKTPASSGSTAPTEISFESGVIQCLPTVSGNQAEVERVADVDGNGLPDVQVGLAISNPSLPVDSGLWRRDSSGDFFLMGQRPNFTGGSCPGRCGHVWSSISFASVFPSGVGTDPASNTELDRRLFSFWLDLNGDGLDDLLYAARPSEGPGGTPTCTSTACWTVRLNQGGRQGTNAVLAARYQTSNNAGLEWCEVSQAASTTCPGGPFRPKYGSLIRVGDPDADGRANILVPSAGGASQPSPFAALVCQYHPGIPRGSVTGICPAGSKGGWDGGLPCDSAFYVCPENPRTDVSIGQTTRGIIGVEAHLKHPATTASGTLDNETGLLPIADLFDVQLQPNSPLQAVKEFNPTIYNMNALRFFEASSIPASNGAVVYGATEVILPEHTAPATASAVDARDIYGDGLMDQVFYSGCFNNSSGSDCAVPFRYAPLSGGQVVEFDHNYVPVTLFGDPNILAKRGYLSQDQGVGLRSVGGSNLPPYFPDMVLMVSEPSGKQTIWDYFPLGSGAGRSITDVPLYAIPAQTSARYVDERHFYFSSSMPVVAEVHQTDGLGGMNTRSFGYVEAMYNHQGRGFRGFRKIVEEDEVHQRRTVTTYEQKFPLTSAVVEREVSSLLRAATDNNRLITVEQSNWRCYNDTQVAPPGGQLDRNSMCSPPALGTTKTIFPFVDSVTTTTFNAAKAEGSVSGTNLAIYQTTVTNADDLNLDGNVSAQSGFDRYGNLRFQSSVTSDVGNGSVGQKRFVVPARKRMAKTFVVDESTWWLDKLTDETTSSRITFWADQALPGGVANPTQTVATSYGWNPNRTLSTQTVQNGILNQATTTTYGYPTTNYGLPSSVSVQASANLDNNNAYITRSTTTEYSTDGYFPAKVTNALTHETQTTVRPRDGQPALVIDPNGLRTTFEYDAFGRMTRTLYRGATDTVIRMPNQSHAWATCVSNCPANTYLRHVVVQDGAPTSTEYLDMYGRVLRTDTRLLDGTVSMVETRYNKRGLVSQVSEPYRSGDTQYWTVFGNETQYDVLGRPRQKTVPKFFGAGIGELRTTYTYNGTETKIELTNTGGSCYPNSLPACPTMYRDVDALGRIASTRDALSNVTKYWYDADGNALAIQAVNGSITSAAYNALGHRTNVADANQGASSYVYNALGEVLRRTDARAIATNYQYDALGRMSAKSATVDVTGDAVPDSVADSWFYETSGVPKGQLGQVFRYINGTLEKSVTYTYDSLSRPTRKTSSQNQGTGGAAAVFITDTAYDSYYGRPKQLTYQSGESIWLRYSKYGHATREASWPAQADYRQVLSVNNRGQALSEKLGTQITASYAYTAATGQMVSAVYTTPSITIRQLNYQYDVFGNVLQQSLAGGGTTENYAYDQLQRLTQATRAGGASGAVSYAYDAAGNFTSKSDFSTTALNAYNYLGGSCGGGPNAVKSVAIAATLGGGTRNYCYDANGNLTSYSMSGGTAGSFFAKYDHDNLPYQTSRTAQFTTRSASISYDADGARVRQSGTDGTRLYDGAYEKVLSPSIEEKVYVGDYAVLTKPNGSTTRINYLLKDRLGSVDTVTDATGAIAEQRGYDAFGKPRQGSWADLTPPRLANIANTPRGFTQHEHLNSVELIHMNGRAYDYNLGRFLSVDPIIQFPTNSQSLNPYSYIMNNPLSGTDPTGFAESCIEGTSTGCKEELTVESIEQTKSAPLGSHVKSVTTTTATLSDGTTITQSHDGAFAGALTINSGGNGATGLTSLGNSRTDGKDGGNQGIGQPSTQSVPEQLMPRSSSPTGTALAGDGLVNESKVHLLKRHKVASYKSNAKEGKIPFLKRVGREIRAYADKTKFEACGDICVDASGTYMVDVVTIRSHVGCGTSGVCASGFSNTDETIHGHGTDSSFRVNQVDAIVNTYLREKSRVTGQDLNKFSEQDFRSGPGFLATDSGLIYQSGRGSEIDYGPY
jgi:RHS repeat-associated protein